MDRWALDKLHRELGEALDHPVVARMLRTEGPWLTARHFLVQAVVELTQEKKPLTINQRRAQHGFSPLPEPTSIDPDLLAAVKDVRELVATANRTWHNRLDELLEEWPDV